MTAQFSTFANSSLGIFHIKESPIFKFFSKIIQKGNLINQSSTTIF